MVAGQPHGKFKSNKIQQPLPRIANNNWGTGGGNNPPPDNTAWLINNPDFDEKPATMLEFLGPGYLDIDPVQNPNLPKGVGVRPGVKAALIDIFGTEIDPRCISIARRAMFTGGIGVGKQFDLSVPILTPKGWVKNGDLKVGDEVIGKNGKATKVVAVFDNESVERYRVHFKDGTWINAGADHKWEVIERKHKRDKKTGKLYRGTEKFVTDTRMLAGQNLKYADSWKYEIPLVDPVEFNVPFTEIIDAYTLGWYISNGSTRNSGTPKISCHIDDFEYLKSSIKTPGSLHTYEKPDRNGATIWIRSGKDLRRKFSNPFSAALNELGLFGVHTLDKFIPKSYLTAPVSVRFELLRGLMDSDGCANAGNRSQFSTSSRLLANDVCDLVRGLGGYCTLTSFERMNTEYIVHVNMDQVCPFKMSRKADKWKPRTNQKPHRSIVKIEKIEDGPGRCIMVDAPDHLYVAKDYIVSHNSTLASIALAYMVHWVSCLHDPQSFFELLPGSRIAFMLMSTKDSQAKEVLFGDIKALVGNSEWFKKNALPNNGQGEKNIKNVLKFPRSIWLIPGNSQETTFEGYNILGGVIDEGDCVDTETEILTSEGWKKYNQLNVGDEILTLNHETGLSEWQPCLEVKIFDAAPRKAVQFEGKEFSSVTTLNHRWPVVRPRQRGGKAYADRIWTTTESFGFHDRISRSAPSSDLPTEAKYSDSLVEMVAWFYTEGCDVYKNGKTAYIYQSHIMNPGNCARIRAALTDLFGNSVDSFPRTGTKTDGIPRWLQLVKSNDDPYWGDGMEFRLNVDAGKIIQDFAPNRVPSFEFLRSLTKSQLELFINISMLADNNGDVRFSQKRKDMAEAFAFACILSGRSVSIKRTSINTCPMWTVTMQKKQFHKPVAAANIAKSGNSSGMKMIKGIYNGIIWCPRVDNGSWLARRNGTIYYTGNSHKQTNEKDYAEAGWSTIHGRIGSRFTDPLNGKHRGLLMAIGQMKKQDGFMARKKKELLKDDDAVVVTMTIWESRGEDYYRDPKTGKVNIFYYDINRRVIVPPLAAQAVKSDQIIEIPIAYQKDFENDPVKALRDHAGIPPAVEDPFIAATDRVDEAQDKWQERFSDLGYTVDSDTSRPSFHPDFFATDALKRAIHVDIAYASNGDAMGMCMGHVSEIVDVDGEIKPYIIIDFLLRIKPSGGQQLMLSDFRQIIYDLRDDMNFKIGVVTYDGFQSVDSVQILKKKRFNTAELSVDKKKGPYEDLRQAIYERRIEFPRYMTYLNKGDLEKTNIVKKELLELQDVGLKIDHPPNGSKDVADAMAGVVHVLMGNNSYRRGAQRGDRKVPLMEDDQDLSKISVAEKIDDKVAKDLVTKFDPFQADSLKKLGLPPIEKDPFSRLRNNWPM